MGTWRPIGWVACMVLLVAAGTGCMTGPLLDNPLRLQPQGPYITENPLWVPQGHDPTSYSKLFEKVLDIMSEYFEICYANRYDGRIETFPSTAPGLEQFWKPGSPDLYQRWLATLQSLRYRAFVLIQPADDGGFFVQVTVFRELEDLEKPLRATAGAASFRSDSTVERQNEVIDAAVFDSHWIPTGRDTCLEQAILEKLKSCR